MECGLDNAARFPCTHSLILKFICYVLSTFLAIKLGQTYKISNSFAKPSLKPFRRKSNIIGPKMYLTYKYFDHREKRTSHLQKFPAIQKQVLIAQ